METGECFQIEGNRLQMNAPLYGFCLSETAGSLETRKTAKSRLDFVKFRKFQENCEELWKLDLSHE